MDEYYSNAPPSQAKSSDLLPTDRGHYHGHELGLLSAKGLTYPSLREDIEARACRRPEQQQAVVRKPAARKAASNSERCLHNTISDNSPLRTPSVRPAWNCTTTAHLQRSGLGLRQAFPDFLPSKPYCSDDPRFGVLVRSLETAMRKSHVQLNHPGNIRWVVVDIDRPDAWFAADDAMLPPFNVIMRNPRNGHCHGAYLLDVPVTKYEISRQKPIRYLAAIERGLIRRLGADQSYSGLLAKNPAHEGWQVEWRREAPYSLEELAQELTQQDMRWVPTAETFGLSRNCDIFNLARHDAYRECLALKRDGGSLPAWRRRVEEIASNHNMTLSEPLSDMEIGHIAKSIAKWTWAKFSEEAFSDLQRARVMKRWHGHEAASETKPWERIGVSRRAYYQKQARERNNGGQ